MAKSNVETATELLGVFSEAGVKDIFEQRPWMKGKKFILVTTQIELEKLVDEMIASGICALDTETNGLNTRQKNGQPWSKLVGFCVSNNPDVGYYVPVGHSDTEYNVPMVIAVREIARLVANCICIYHNFKFDGQLLRNYGIICDDADKYEDTLLMAAVEDASRRRKGLKELSDKILQRPMLEIKDMGIQATGKVEKLFFMVPPPKAVYYGAGDAMCTFALYLHFKKRLDEMDPLKKGGPWFIYKVEKQCLFATMEMERNYARLDIPYLKKLREDIIVRMTKCQEGMYAIVGREFDIESPKQLGILLFDELKIKYPIKEKSDSGQYITDESVLEKLKDQYPIANMILTFRGFRKILSTYLDNFLNNADENDEVKFQMNQVQADTGRFSASGGYGLEEDGYCGVNCQNIPKYNKKDPNSVDLRKAIIGRPGTKIVTVDYSGEELRIATNISKEPKWLNEFLHGSGDLHAITGRAIHQKAVIDDKERGVGKTLNFLTLFGGGPGRFSAQAKIPYETAKKFIINFFNTYTVLKAWIDKEAKASRKRGFSLTAFGRRRPLTEYYATNDKEEMAKGDRLAINSRIQGCLQGHVRCLTNKGYIPILEIKTRKEKGEDFLVWTGTSWETFDVLDRGGCQLAEIELSNGLTLHCDTRHEVLVEGDEGYVFKKFAELTEDDKICVSIPRTVEFGGYPEQKEFSGGSAPNSKNVRIRDQKDYDFIAYLMGTAIGDGTIRIDCVNKKYSVTISFGIEKIRKNYEYLKNGLKRIGIKLSDYRRSKGSKGESYTADANSLALINIFEYYGFKKADSKNKRVPLRIFECPLSMRLEFLRGCFDTDCCKKRANRYGLHTANLELLKDIQLIGWTVGLSSIVKTLSDGSHLLTWSDLCKFEKVLGLKRQLRIQRPCGKMHLPKFLNKKVYSLLKNVESFGGDRDRALLCKLNKMRNVLVSTAVDLLEKYGCEKPVMYYQYNLKKKTILDRSESTYTLSVHSPLHRFDSSAIISKNTGADILKIALYRLYRWIHNNGLEEYIRILMPIHDEVVFEIREDKLNDLIPEICEIMKLKDKIKQLQWEVPLEVDAEYGDSYHVTNNYWEERKEKEETKVGNAEEKKDAVTENSEKTQTQVEVPTDRALTLGTTTVNNAVSVFKDVLCSTDSVSVIKENITNILEESFQNNSVPIFRNAKPADRIGPDGYFYHVTKADAISARKIRYILDILSSSGQDFFIGPKYRICLVGADGEVFHRTAEIVAIDSFLALCLDFGI